MAIALTYEVEYGGKFILSDYIKDGWFFIGQCHFFSEFGHEEECFTYELSDEEKVFTFYSEFRRKYNSEVLEKLLLQRIDEKIFQYYLTEKSLDEDQLDEVMICLAFGLDEKSIRKVANKNYRKKSHKILYEFLCEKYEIEKPFKYFVRIDGEEYECTKTDDNRIVIPGFPPLYIRGYYPEPY